MEGGSDQKDEELASLIQSGKVEFFGLLVERYENKILRYAKKFLYKHEDIEDTVQEIFTKAYINIKSFDARRKFSSWLYRIAHNELVNALKKNSRRSFLPLFDLDVFFPRHAKDGNNIEEQISNQELQKLIDTCLNKLKEKYKEAIILHYVEELSYKEIAEILQIPVSTVGIRINRAKKMMKIIFKQQGYNHGK